MVTHRIRLSEPVWVTGELTVDDDGNIVRTDPEPDHLVEGYDAEYECTCGERFGPSLPDAQEHLQEIAASDTGEAVTSPTRMLAPSVSATVTTRDSTVGPDIRVDLELPVVTAMRLFVVGYWSNSKCSGRLAWSAYHGVRRALYGTDDTVEITVYYADPGWWSYLQKILSTAITGASGQAQADLQAVKDALRTAVSEADTASDASDSASSTA